jgi:hypothetical protein
MSNYVRLFSTYGVVEITFDFVLNVPDLFQQSTRGRIYASTNLYVLPLREFLVYDRSLDFDLNSSVSLIKFD